MVSSTIDKDFWKKKKHPPGPNPYKIWQISLRDLGVANLTPQIVQWSYRYIRDYPIYIYQPLDWLRYWLIYQLYMPRVYQNIPLD